MLVLYFTSLLYILLVRSVLCSVGRYSEEAAAEATADAVLASRARRHVIHRQTTKTPRVFNSYSRFSFFASYASNVEMI